MYDVCVASDEFLDKSTEAYRGFTIEVYHMYSPQHGISYYLWNILLHDGSSYGMVAGGFKTAAETVADAKKVIDEKFVGVVHNG